MERVTRREGGMFPAPAEITKTCSCPDWADVCKHVAAVLYGVGARLDHQPELLFVLRKVDPAELIENAGNVDGLVRADGSAAHHKTLADDQLADVFGIDLEPEAPLPASAAKPRDVRAVRGAASPAASKSPAAGKSKARAGGKKKSDSGRGRTAKDGGKVSKARGDHDHDHGRGRGRRKAPIS
jgi:hypothetical protein